MADLHEQHGVLTACAVTAQVSPNMTVAVAAGSIINANIAATVTAQNATITAADATNDRIDTITVGNTGTVTVNAGTPAATPVAPDSADVEIAQVYVYSQANANYTGTIVSSVIQDTRRYALVHTSPYHVSPLIYGPLGPVGTAAGWSNNRLHLVPFFTAKQMPVDAVGVYVSSAGTAGSKARLGLYSDDGSNNLTLLYDAGQVAVDVTSSQYVSGIGQTLAPGWWWFGCAFQSLGVTKPTMATIDVRGSSPIGANNTVQAATQSYGDMYQDSVSGALPTSPNALKYDLGTPAPGVWVQAS